MPPHTARMVRGDWPTDVRQCVATKTDLMRLLPVLLAPFLLATPASAQWSVTAYLGDATTSASRFDVRSSAADTALVVEPIAFDDESFRSPLYYGVRLTRRFERASWFGLEAEFIHAKAITDPSRLVRARGRFNGDDLDGQQRLGAILPRFELSHGLNFLLANAVFHWPNPHDDRARINVLGRLGMGPTFPHVESTFLTEKEDAYQRGRVAFAGALGAEVRLANRLSALVELKVTRTRQRVHAGSAEIEGVFTTRHLVAGLTWRLASAGHRPFIR